MPDVTVAIQLLLNGILIGSVYGLMGLGLSLIFGVMGVINSAHGAFYMLAGYMIYFSTIFLGFNFAIAIIFALVLLAVVAIALERTLIAKTLVDENTVMIATLGLAVAIQGVVLILFGSAYVPVPPMVHGNLILGAFHFDAQIAIAFAIAIASALAVRTFLKLSRTGKAMRAVSQNRELASMLGISVQKVSALAFVLGTTLAGLAGVTLSPVFSLNPVSAWTPLVISFVVVVVGGLGSLEGTMLAGILYGVADSITQFYFPNLTSINVLLFMIAILLIRPTGLFGKMIERA